jgi:hypothetical protein
MGAAMKVLFFVQPYLLRRGKLRASGASSFEDAPDALAAGIRAARFRPGVVVIAQAVDGRSGSMGKPAVLAIHGRVPDAWRAAGDACRAA